MYKILIRQCFLKKALCFLLIGMLIISNASLSYAQALSLSPTAIAAPAPTTVLRGLKVYPQDPFRFDFVVEHQKETDKDEANRLIKYFLASLTIPEQDLWVNLSPYEKDRIVPESFGQTEMGRDLLAQDYVLKQITSSLMNPQEEIGKAFWEKIYQKAQEEFGTTDIPIDTFNKVWIVPAKAVVYENAQSKAIYIVESKLNVMLETDYLAESQNMISQTRGHTPEGGVSPSRLPSNVGLKVKATQVSTDSQTSDSQSIAQEILKEIIIPVLEKEVNEGSSFKMLRQIYHSLILATWYKNKIKESLLSQGYVDQNKTQGIRLEDNITAQEKMVKAENIWQDYVELFKKGVYNFIQEENINGEIIPKQYFSGGKDFTATSKLLEITQDPSQLLDKKLKVDVLQINTKVLSKQKLLVTHQQLFEEFEVGQKMFFPGELLERKGEGVLLLGASGSGKSALAMELLKKKPDEWSLVSAGSSYGKIEIENDQPILIGFRETESNVIYSRTRGKLSYPLSSKASIRVRWIIVLDDTLDQYFFADSDLRDLLGIRLMNQKDLDVDIDGYVSPEDVFDGSMKTEITPEQYTKILKTYAELKKMAFEIKKRTIGVEDDVNHRLMIIKRWVERYKKQPDEYFYDHVQQALNLMEMLKYVVEKSELLSRAFESLEHEIKAFQKSQDVIAFNDKGTLIEGKEAARKLMYDLQDKANKTYAMPFMTFDLLSFSIENIMARKRVSSVGWERSFVETVDRMVSFDNIPVRMRAYFKMLDDILNPENIERNAVYQGREQQGLPQDMYRYFLIPAYEIILKHFIQQDQTTFDESSTLLYEYPQKTGGVDFSKQRMDMMEVKKDDQEKSFVVDLEQLKKLKESSGVEPVITQVHSLIELNTFLLK